MEETNAIRAVDLIFIVIFWVDLIWNVYANFGTPFFSVFTVIDGIIVFTLTILFIIGGANLGFLRIFRIFMIIGKIERFKIYVQMLSRIFIPTFLIVTSPRNNSLNLVFLIFPKAKKYQYFSAMRKKMISLRFEMIFWLKETLFVNQKIEKDAYSSILFWIITYCDICST